MFTVEYTKKENMQETIRTHRFLNILKISIRVSKKSISHQIQEASVKT